MKKNLLSYENLMMVNYDGDDGIYELEFQENKKSYIIAVKASDHKVAESDEDYFDNKEVVEKIIADTDEEEIIEA